MVLGHEVAGVVAQVGEGVERFQEGDRVVVTHHVPCNACRYCLSGHHTVCDTLHHTNFDPGGLAEYLRVPAINVDRGVFTRAGSHVSLDEAAFTEPLACVLRGQRRADLQPGQTVLVLGSGLTGMLHVDLARSLGAGRILATDLSDYRLEAARRFGADVTIPADEDVPARVREANERTAGRLSDCLHRGAARVTAGPGIR